MDNRAWRLSLILDDATSKKEVEEFLDFVSLEAAEAAIHPFENDSDRKTGKVFRVTNAEGEYVEFKGAHLHRHKVKKLF